MCSRCHLFIIVQILIFFCRGIYARESWRNNCFVDHTGVGSTGKYVVCVLDEKMVSYSQDLELHCEVMLNYKFNNMEICFFLTFSKLTTHTCGKLCVFLYKPDCPDSSPCLGSLDILLFSVFLALTDGRQPGILKHFPNPFYYTVVKISALTSEYVLQV